MPNYKKPSSFKMKGSTFYGKSPMKQGKKLVLKKAYKWQMIFQLKKLHLIQR